MNLPVLGGVGGACPLIGHKQARINHWIGNLSNEMEE
jgi:hypothetical protein